MHHLAVKTELLDTNYSDIKNVGLKGGNDAPVCPKPRRVGSTLPAQFLNHPCLCRKLHDRDSDGRSGILDIIAEKRMDGRDELGRCKRCSSPMMGSPPGRTNNPLVHDVHFLQLHARMDLFPPFTSST
ncbi:hypothetical protein Salat_1335100 [Sesamum alatum]|uniref:Uncharacterized protein n=1 Tax=Sesamum alatum TaxID=300844 RepID=A0AAE1YHT2_9LAMI|nr:hypothetical protein Salat_1335100 [Sesamum alatum]